jgi:sterol desaturase/sphingolipid hydroxylase (fatty acid hydroxylase superfamily)
LLPDLNGSRGLPMHFESIAVEWNAAVTALSSHAIAPLLGWLHLERLADDPREIATALLISSVQVLIVAAVFRPLEALVPAERWIDRRYARIDRFYTLFKLFGVLPIFTYLLFDPLTSWVGGLLDGSSGSAGGSDGLLNLQRMFPWLRQHALLLFLAYFAIFDLVYYLYHRLQHAVPCLWALHSLHHSQRQLNCWSNDRDHYLDDLFEVLVITGTSLLIGVAPVDYALLILAGELIQNFSHANVRIGFGRIADKLIVDPKYHRLHHMVIDPERPHMHNCNFALVFPAWDILFGTALYNEKTHPTGVDDPAIDADNMRGFVGQQVAGFKRFLAALPRPGAGIETTPGMRAE